MVTMPHDALENPRLDGLPNAVILSYLRALGRSNRWALDGLFHRSSVMPIAREWIAAGLAIEAPPIACDSFG